MARTGPAILRRMEDRGEVRGGRFVSGVGEQFAMANAILLDARATEPKAIGSTMVVVRTSVMKASRCHRCRRSAQPHRGDRTRAIAWRHVTRTASCTGKTSPSPCSTVRNLRWLQQPASGTGPAPRVWTPEATHAPPGAGAVARLLWEGYRTSDCGNVSCAALSGR